MANELLSLLEVEALLVLLKARRLEKWVAMEHLAAQGMNRELLHALEDMGLILVSSHSSMPTMKLTARGVNVALRLV